MMISGSAFSVAFSISRVSFSPTTEPIEPPRKLKSITPNPTRCSPILPMPVMTASFWPGDFLVLGQLGRVGGHAGEIEACPRWSCPRPFPRTNRFRPVNECVRARRSGNETGNSGRPSGFRPVPCRKPWCRIFSHLVQRPSGISRFLDFAAGQLGLLDKVGFRRGGGRGDSRFDGFQAECFFGEGGGGH